MLVCGFDSSAILSTVRVVGLQTIDRSIPRIGNGTAGGLQMSRTTGDQGELDWALRILQKHAPDDASAVHCKSLLQKPRVGSGWQFQASGKLTFVKSFRDQRLDGGLQGG